MNEQQAVALRDPRDPFSQALALLFKEASNPRELKEKYWKEMIPLVTQVAFKIGAIDTEKSVAERAIPVFVGIISIYLAKQTGGVGNARQWIDEISAHDFSNLFRMGYTLIDLILKKRWRLEVRSGDKTRFYTTAVERIEVFATHRQDGVWAGYQLYADELDGVLREQVRIEFADWLSKNYHGSAEIRKAKSKLFSEPEIFDHGEIIRRVFYNVCYNAIPSIRMDWNRARSIVDEAKKNRSWISGAKERFAEFVSGLPEQFRQEFAIPVGKEITSGRGIFGEAENVLGNLNAISSKKKYGRAFAIDYICVQTGVSPPMLSIVARKCL